MFNTKMETQDVVKSFPKSQFQVIPNDQKIEEERLIDYRAERFYPIQLGQILNDRFQILAKLGFGTASTVWLCRDLK